MSSLWPQFVIPQPLDGARTWTASFDSYDQYRERCYYCVRLFDGTQLLGELMARSEMLGVGEDWTVPGAMDPIYKDVASVAATGVTNTDWGGYFGRDPADPFTHLATDPWRAITTSERSSDNGRWLLRDSRISAHDIWQVDLVERWTKRVHHTWHSWSLRARSLRWDGNIVIVTTASADEPFTPA